MRIGIIDPLRVADAHGLQDIDHAPAAIGAGVQPRAAQLRVSVLGRARIATSAGQTAEDTGDLRAGTGYAPQSGASEILADADATRVPRDPQLCYTSPPR